MHRPPNNTSANNRVVAEMALPTGAAAPQARANLWARWAVVFVWVLTFLTFVGLLWHLMWRGWAHSYDAAIYVRSLWGVAHGELFNPVVGLHTFSIHGNFVLLLLAPLARLFHPLTVLVVAQSAAIATTTAIIADEVRRHVATAGTDRPVRSAAVLYTGVAIVLGAPLIANPFLFDVRPDLIGVPLLTWGLVRAWRLGDFDARTVLVMLSALLVREEYMMVVVGALALAPFPRPWRSSLKLRIVGSLAAVGYWAFYWFVFRRWIGDGSYEIAQDVGAAFLDSSALGLGAVARYKFEIVFSLLATAGGTALLGWRWLGAAVPGALLLLGTSRMQELTLNFHYVQFVAPGLAVATLAGMAEWLKRGGGARAWPPVAAAALVTVTFALSSALPGGGRYRYENFYVGPRADASEVAALRDAHELLERVPDGVGLAAPHELAAPLANRSHVVPIATFLEELSAGRLDDEVEWVALPGNAWADAGRALVAVHGFMLVGVSGTNLALLTRDSTQDAPGMVDIPPEPPASCRAPVGVWPSAGLVLCDARVDEGRLRLRVFRSHPTSDGLPQAPMTMIVVDPSSGAVDTAWIARGLVSVSQLPMGAVVEVVAERPVAAPGKRDVALVVDGSGPIFARFADAAAPDRVGRAIPVEF